MIQGDPLVNQEYANEFLDNLVSNPPSEPVVVYIDPDVDGLFAGFFFALFLDSRAIPYETYMNKDRRHGFLADPEQFRGRTILSGDFQVSEEQFRSIVLDYDIRYLSSDHHENDVTNRVLRKDGELVGVLMNPQFEDEPQKVQENYQSGAGVVLDILSHYDPSLLNDETLGMVGITLLTDVRPIETPNARYFLDILYNLPYSGIIKYYIDSINEVKPDYGFGVPSMTRQFIDYKFAPYVNSMIRFNKGQEAIDFIFGKITPKEDYPKMQKALVQYANTTFPPTLLGNVCQILVYKISAVDEKYRSVFGNFLGMLASHNARNYPTLAILFGESGAPLRASFRGPSAAAPYRELLQNHSGYLCEGHRSAFGAHIEKFDKDFVRNYLAAMVEASNFSDEDAVPNIVEVTSLKNWLDSGGKETAYDNQYHLNSHKVALKLVGPWAFVDERASYQVYSDSSGVSVKTFDANLNPGNSLIDPVYDRGSVSFNLMG